MISLAAHIDAAVRAAAAIPGRAARGRPLRVLARAAVAGAIAAAAALTIQGTPAAPGVELAAALWLAVTARPELAPAAVP